MTTEYIIWGIPENGSEEKLLVSEQAKLNLEQAEQVCKWLVEQKGCAGCRIQAVKLTGNPVEDFIQAVLLQPDQSQRG